VALDSQQVEAHKRGMAETSGKEGSKQLNRYG
jgi:hypothetical protein